jgi:hypothetical protein
MTHRKEFEKLRTNREKKAYIRALLPVVLKELRDYPVICKEVVKRTIN